MSKKLLFNNENKIVETITGNPIYISDVKTTDDPQAEVISIVSLGSTDSITIYSSNCPYIFAKGGRINVNS